MSVPDTCVEPVDFDMEIDMSHAEGTSHESEPDNSDDCELYNSDSDEAICLFDSVMAGLCSRLKPVPQISNSVAEACEATLAFDVAMQELGRSMRACMFEYTRCYHRKALDSKRPPVMDTTDLLQFLWSTKHRITDECMYDLVAMVKHPAFMNNSVKSASTIKRRISCLPTDPAYGLDVPVDRVEVHDDEEPVFLSHAKETEEFVFASLKDKIKKALLNPIIRDKIQRTNNARYAQMNREFSHGRQYWESPWFTFDRAEIRTDVYVNLGDRIVLGPSSADVGGENQVCHLTGLALDDKTGERVFRLRRYVNISDPCLPRLTVADRKRIGMPRNFDLASSEQLVLTEHEEVLSDLSRILRTVSISESNSDSNYTCQWGIRGGTWTPVAKLEKHPTDRNSFAETARRMRLAEQAGHSVYRLFIVLYIDGFGIYRRARHTTDGIYFTFGNLDRADRHDLKNVLCLGMKPPNVALGGCLRALIAELKELQRGYYVDLGITGTVFVIGTLGVCIADMPQAMQLAGCQHHTSNFPCRHCTVAKGDELGNAEFNIAVHQRTSEDIKRQRDVSGVGRGIGETSPFADQDLAFDEVRGCPTEPMHSEKGYQKTLVSLLLKALKSSAVLKLSSFLRRPKLWPWSFSKLSLSREGKVSLTFTQASHFMQIVNLLLVRRVAGDQGALVFQDWLKPDMFNKKMHIELRARLGRNFCQKIREGFVLAAAANAAIFVEEMDSGSSALLKLSQCIVASRMHNRTVWGPALNLPNAHTGLHIPDAADRFGVPNNVNAGRFETRHGRPKRIGGTSNNRGLERQMVMDAQACDALVYIAGGGPCSTQYTSLTDDAKYLLLSPNDDVVQRLLGDRKHVDMHGGEEGYNDANAAAALRGNEVIWKRFIMSLELSDVELLQLPIMHSNDKIECFSFGVVILPNREPYRAKMVVGESWELSSVDIRLPIGPRVGVCIIHIMQLLRLGSEAFVRVRFFRRISSRPHSMTHCHTYKMQSLATDHIVPATSLLRKVHMHESASSYFLNPFFVK